MPDVRLALDPKTGNLVAWARPSEHATIKATLEELQRDARRFDVIQLRTLDPQVAVAAITKLFAADAGPGAPKVDADPASRQLLIRGSESQIKQIRSMLEQMGELSAGDGKDGGGPVRMLPLSPRATEAALIRLQEIWPTLRGNRIRVVTPSPGIPSVRPSADSETPPAGGRTSEVELRPSVNSPEDLLEQIQNPREESCPRRRVRIRSSRDSRATSRHEGRRRPSPGEAPAIAAPRRPEEQVPPGATNRPAGIDGLRILGPRIVFAAQALAAEPAKPKSEPAKSGLPDTADRCGQGGRVAPPQPARRRRPRRPPSPPIRQARVAKPTIEKPALRPQLPRRATTNPRAVATRGPDHCRPGPGGTVVMSNDTPGPRRVRQAAPLPRRPRAFRQTGVDHLLSEARQGRRRWRKRSTWSSAAARWRAGTQAVRCSAISRARPLDRWED